TMADTIAVMNGGVIEQLGSPAELYESPRTAFVANFLGQSNLLETRITGTSGGFLLLDVHGTRMALPVERTAAQGDAVVMGIRPEKISIQHASAADSNGERNRLDGGVIIDSSFIGVSTQYVVRMPWAQEITVFEQNMERDERLVPGAPVVLHWNPSHGFGLAPQAAAA
ncbi:TOBE domain-containing protein, partial [Yinghuangia seranimata]|uniref:TOBE domain-containing protein n=1 Tax=Yinghuangia seranimata TaxID=408067 RepID=UPI00248C7938